ncbi:LOW QUALITY PROTEIN: uncharacterized protein LKV04_015176 [Tautogolabrus adspersus]
MQDTAVYRAKCIRDNNWTIDQILEEFPRLMTKGMPGTNLVEYLHEAKASRPYPYVLTLGNDNQHASQAFVIIAGQALEHDALLQAINVCFKAFFILDIKYPKQCEHVWEFLQSVIYEMPGGESKLGRYKSARVDYVIDYVIAGDLGPCYVPHTDQYLREKYDDPATQELLNMASFIDPRFRSTYLPENKIEELKERVTSEAEALLPELPTTSQCDADAPTEEATPAKREKRSLGSFFKQPVQPHTKTQGELIEDELSGYLHGIKPDSDTDPLRWWKAHEANYPRLSNLAKKYLCVPASSSPSEIAFSASVNVIPLIAKADTLTPEECQFFKKQMKEIQEHKIKIYEFPEKNDEEKNRLVKKIKDKLPLAVEGSNTIIEVNSKSVRGRQYPWGAAEGENSDHCDFTILRIMLIRNHMQDLKDVTNNVHYENYHSRKLSAVPYNGVDNELYKTFVEGMSPMAQMEEERQEHVTKIKKMDVEMEQVFEMKVKEKVQKFKDSEAELQRRHEQMKKNLEAQHKELEKKRQEHVTKIKKMDVEMEQVFEMKVKEKVQKFKDSEAELQRRHEQMKKNLEAQNKELEKKRRVFEDERANWETQQRLEQQKMEASRTLEKNKKKGKIF